MEKPVDEPKGAGVLRKRVNGWALARERAPLFLSVLLMFSLPLITQPDGMDKILPKMALAQMLVFLILSAWTIQIIMTGKLVWVRTTAFWPLVVLLAWICLSVTVSNYSPAGWGALVLWACFPLWYLLLTLTVYDEAWKAENILLTFLGAALVSSVWALAQFLGMGEGAWLKIVNEQFGGRAAAGLGHPEYLAGYLMMVWPLAFALFLRATYTFSKWFWSGLTVLSLVALYTTGSLAGGLGAFLGALVFLFVYFGFAYDKRPPKKMVFGFIALVALTLLLSLLFIHAGNMTRPEGKAWYSLQVWKGTMNMIRENPILGTGFGTFAAAFPSYRPMSLKMLQQPGLWETNHAHNWILEWTAETGFVGLALLLVFWFFVLSQWWKLYISGAIPKPVGAGVFAAFTGVAVQNLFDLNHTLPGTLVPLLFLAAMPVTLSRRFHHLPGFPISRRELDLSKYRVYLLPVLAGVAALTLQVIKINLQDQFADLKLQKSLPLLEAKQWNEAIQTYARILEAQPDNLPALYSRGSVYSNRAKDGDLEKALADYAAVEKVRPDYRQVHFRKAEVLKRLNRMEESGAEMKRAMALEPLLILQNEEFKKAGQLAAGKRVKDALNIYQKLVFDYPTCVPALTAYANCLFGAGKTADAGVVYKQVLSLDPDNQEAASSLKSLQTAPQRP